LNAYTLNQAIQLVLVLKARLADMAEGRDLLATTAGRYRLVMGVTEVGGETLPMPTLIGMEAAAVMDAAADALTAQLGEAHRELEALVGEEVDLKEGDPA